MLTICETSTFAAEAAKVWTQEERLEFFTWIATNPDAGVVIPRSGGCRKFGGHVPGAASKAA